MIFSSRGGDWGFGQGRGREWGWVCEVPVIPDCMVLGLCVGGALSRLWLLLYVRVPVSSAA